MLQRRNIQVRRQIISVQMLKGGVAKTTTVQNIGLRASQYGLRVLLIDLDQQSNLTYALGLDEEVHPIWLDVVEGRAKIRDAIVPVSETLHLITSNLNNSVLDRVLTKGLRNIASSVSQYLRPIAGDYDLVLFDTAPSLSAINTAVACASTTVILPVTPDKFSLIGLEMTLAEMERVRTEFGASFDERVLITRYDKREIASRETIAQCAKNHKARLYRHVIRTSSEFKNNIRSGRSLFDSKSIAKDDLDLLTREITGLALGES
jgi:chromosome partitioning protein